MDGSFGQLVRKYRKYVVGSYHFNSNEMAYHVQLYCDCMVHGGKNIEDIIWLRSEFKLLEDKQVEKEIIKHVQECKLLKNLDLLIQLH